MSKNDVQIVVGDSDYDELLRRVGDVIQKGRNSIATAVNNAIVQSYWEIGQYIVEYEQKGHAKAEYGSDVLNRLSRAQNPYGFCYGVRICLKGTLT